MTSMKLRRVGRGGGGDGKIRTPRCNKLLHLEGGSVLLKALQGAFDTGIERC